MKMGKLDPKISKHDQKMDLDNLVYDKAMSQDNMHFALVPIKKVNS